MTHTYVILEVSATAYDEIAAKLLAAGYGHAFHVNPTHAEVIDMHGLGLVAAPDIGTPKNLTPDSTILKQVDGQWQKLALFLLYKLAGRTQVRISVEEIQKCSADFAPGVPVMYTHGHQDGISFQVVDEAAARRLAAHDTTMRGHA